MWVLERLSANSQKAKVIVVVPQHAEVVLVSVQVKNKIQNKDSINFYTVLIFIKKFFELFMI